MDKINGNCRNFVLACDLLGWACLFIGNFCSLLYGAVNKDDETSWLNLGFPYVANLVVISHKWVLILRYALYVTVMCMLQILKVWLWWLCFSCPNRLWAYWFLELLELCGWPCYGFVIWVLYFVLFLLIWVELEWDCNILHECY